MIYEYHVFCIVLKRTVLLVDFTNHIASKDYPVYRSLNICTYYIICLSMEISNILSLRPSKTVLKNVFQQGQTRLLTRHIGVYIDWEIYTSSYCMMHTNTSSIAIIIQNFWKSKPGRFHTLQTVAPLNSSRRGEVFSKDHQEHAFIVFRVYELYWKALNNAQVWHA